MPSDGEPTWDNTTAVAEPTWDQTAPVESEQAKPPQPESSLHKLLFGREAAEGLRAGIQSLVPQSVGGAAKMAFYTPVEDAPRAIKEAYDVVRGVPVAQAVPKSQMLVGFTEKPLGEQVKIGTELAGQVAMAGAVALGLRGPKLSETLKPILDRSEISPLTAATEREVIPSATQEGKIQKSIRTERAGTPQGTDVPAYSPQVREVSGEQAGRGDSLRTAAPQEVAPVPQPEQKAGVPRIVSTAVQTPEGIKRGTTWNQPHDEIGAASVESARPSPTQETGKVTPEYEHLKKGIANWYDPNATINAFGKLNDDGSISIPVQRFGVASTDATRGGTWYELNRGGVSDYNALPETGAAKMVGNVATKYGVGGKERVESQITTKKPFLVNATKLHEGQYPLELAKKVLSEEEFRKAKRGITGANAEKAYSRLEKLTSQRLQEQGHDAVIFYHKYEYGSIPHQIFKLPAEAGVGTKIAVTTEPIAGAGVPRESVAASAKPPSVPEGETRPSGVAAALKENQKGFIIREPDGTERFTNDRTEAAGIAKAAGQVKPENADTTALHSQQLAEQHPLQGQTYYRGTNPNRVSGEDQFYSSHKPTAEEYSAGGPGGAEGKVTQVQGESLPRNLYQAFDKEDLAKKLGIDDKLYGTAFDNAVKSKLQPQGYEGVRYEAGTTLGDLTSGGQEEIHVFSPVSVAGEGIPTTPQPKEILPKESSAAVSGTEMSPAAATRIISDLPDPSNVTAIKNEIVDRERAARGLPSAVEPARRAFGEAWEQASKKINDDPQYVDDLLKGIRGKPRALTDVEDAALLHRQIDLQNQFDKTSTELVRAQELGDADALAENRVRYAALSDKLLDLYNVGKASGTETGRGLAARKLLADENFTLANMVTQKRAALQGKPLTPEQMAEVEAYSKDILEADRKLAEYEKQPKKESARLKAAKTRLEMSKTELERRIAFSDFEKAQRAEPIKLDKEGLQLRAALERKKQEYWQSLMKDRMAQRTISEKVQDTFTKWRRGFILSSPNVLAKLTSAAAERMAFTPLEETTGAGLRKLPLVSQVAERAPMEGHPSITSEAKAITEGFTSGMKDAWAVLQTGRSDLDVQFGKKNVLPPSVIDFIGQIHGALKAIPKRNEFARRFQQGIEQGIASGVDVTDPMVQARIATQAYKQANRSIFLQDNRVVAAWQRAISALEQPSKATGVIPPGSKALATTMKVLVPIVKVPTNIVAETLQYSTGLVTGSARLANAFRNGIGNLKPEQADLIMRELKKGSVGGAALVLGYLNADKIGGYYQPGQKRPKEDVKFGQIRIFGVNIPTYLIHNPLLEQLQIGATIRRVADSKLRKKDTSPQGIPSGIMAAALGVTEEVPFVRETMGELPKLFRPNERQQFLGELSKSLAIPAVVQWAAYQMDKRGGEPVRRETNQGTLPEIILQNIESGIPGLRQTLPEKVDKRSSTSRSREMSRIRR